MAVMLYVAIGLVTLCVLVLMKALQVNRHWKKHGIPSPKPVLFFGNLLPTVIGKKSMGEIFREIHEAYPNEPVVGYYHFMQPRLLIRDRNLIDNIFIKDFGNFTSRFGEPDVLNDPLNSNLFNISGNYWRSIRAKFAPMFTTGKLRHMFSHIDAIGNDFIKYLNKVQDGSKDTLDIIKTYTIDVISSTAFGMQPAPMEDDTNRFRQEGRTLLTPSLWLYVRFLAILVFPSFAQKLGLNITSKASTKYFSGALKDVLNHRKKTGAVRNDFVQQMVVLQEKGYIVIDNPDSSDDYLKIQEAPGMKIEPTDDLMAGQAYAFLIAGFDTTAITLMMSLFDLALHPEVQEKARADVKKVITSMNGELTYDCLKSMEYLDGCLKETQRFHSIVPVLNRRCTATYKIPGIPYTIKQGESIVISSYAFHHDKELYPEPENYLPERWMSESSKTSFYVPFGYGPRICIGMRFALSEIKCIVAKILDNYKISLHPSVKLPLTSNPLGIMNQPVKNPRFVFEKLSTS